MKRYNTIELIRQIEDKELFESVYAGFSAIYESGDNMIVDEMVDETYDEALEVMDNHFSHMNSVEQYREELDPFAMKLFQRYKKYQDNIEKSLEQLDETEFELVANTATELLNFLSGHNSFEEYARILKDKIKIFIGMFGSPENMVAVFNDLIESEKFNALLHRVKDRFIPAMNQLKNSQQVA